MEDDVFPPDTMLGTLSDTSMDFDLMDELFLGGCLLETIDGSELLQPGPSTSSALFDSSYFLPSSEINSGRSDPTLPQNNNQDEREILILSDNPSTIDPQTEINVKRQSLNQNTVEIAECADHSESYAVEGSELSRRWWIGPRANPGPSSSMTERLMQALEYIKESTKDRDVLIQIWVPIKRGGKHVLTTNDQPFSLDPNCQRLACYRNISMNYEFPAEEGSKVSAGLPGRVFLGKVPEWTPDVRFFNRDEYPRVDYAWQYNVCGTLALPVFERGSRTCLGVVEVVMTRQKINYRPELDSICKALEAVDLRSSEVSSTQNVQASKESYQAALPEILEVLRSVCETHRLPLAQTWVPCIQQGKGGCQHSDENYTHCVSSVDSSCYVTNPHFWGFQEACSQHHLLRGQGVVGRAITTNQPCFSTDITAISKRDYPLSHYARMFGLCAAVAIRLRSFYTGTADYILEFFLPVDCRDTEEQKQMLSSLSIVIQRVCQSLRVITDKELEEEAVLPVSEVVVPSDGRPIREETIITDKELEEEAVLPVSEVVVPSDGRPIREETKVEPTPSKVSSRGEQSWVSPIMEAQRKGKGVPAESQKDELREEFKVTTHWDNPEVVLHYGEKLAEFRQHPLISDPKGSVERGGDSSSFGERSFSSAGKTGEKRRTKTEKAISLQVLRKYFAGSLKDAAKSIGVCPTTLKRICRQRGITRWPSRKIKKVGHSLRKLQVVIDSVQGAEGAFQIDSFYENFPDLASPNLSGTSLLSNSKLSDHPKLLNIQPKGGLVSPRAAASKSHSSSCSHSSSSSLCCSSGIQHHPHTLNLAGREEASMVGNPGGVLKRVRSDTELHVSSQEEPRLLARSHSHKDLSEHHSLESLPPLPKSRSRTSRDRGAPRVKVTHGEEKIRFSMKHNWGFEDLQQEIARRFNIDDMSRMDLKYLDDDSEWVLLTCGADLEECMDIYKSSGSHTIKLSVHQSSRPNLGPILTLR